MVLVQIKMGTIQINMVTIEINMVGIQINVKIGCFIFHQLNFGGNEYQDPVLPKISGF